MKYSSRIDNNLPLTRVTELFDDMDNINYWQEGFICYEPVEIIPEHTGATTQLPYRTGNRKIDMTATIIEPDFPKVFTATYETKGGRKLVHNHFETLVGHTISWTAPNQFDFSGFFTKLHSLVVQGTLKSAAISA